MGDHDGVEPVITMRPISVITIAWRMQLKALAMYPDALEQRCSRVNRALCDAELLPALAEWEQRMHALTAFQMGKPVHVIETMLLGIRGVEAGPP